VEPFTATGSYAIPAQGGEGVVVKAGARFRITDVEGTQVSDLWAICTDEPEEWLSTGHTMASVRYLFPRVGEEFFTNRCRPVLRLEADESPGIHDMFYPPCNSQLFVNEGMGVDHPSCTGNFLRVTANLGIDLPVVPASVNIFQNSPPLADGAIPIIDAATKAGDSITFRALRDAAIVVTACSVDFPPGNGERCTPILLEVDDAMPEEGLEPPTRGL
jgi:uncharacterized protein YcgI (DUF1989 family)